MLIGATAVVAALAFVRVVAAPPCNETLFDSPSAAVRAHISCREALPFISHIECLESSHVGDTVTCTTGRHPDAFCQLRRTDEGLWWIDECTPAS